MDPIIILILIFLFFPLIKRIFQGLKGGAELPGKEETGKDPWSQPDSELDRRGPRQTERTAQQHREGRGEQSWEDFFEGLEQVLTGEEPERQSRSAEDAQRQERASRTSASQSTRSQDRTQRDSTYRHPSHGPVHGSSSRSGSGSRSGSASSDPFSYEGKSGEKIGAHADQVSRELIEGDNPIYKDLGDSPEVVVADVRGRKYIKGVLMDPEKLRDGFLIKEILDSPKSRRRNHHRF